VRTPAEILEAVADGFESGRYGWIQGRYENTEGFCSMGALYYEYRYDRPVTYTLDEHLEMEEGLLEAADRLQVRAGSRSIPSWNDAYGRTKEEVIDTFKMAAKDARNQETP
jgi:hypothetical protein